MNRDIVIWKQGRYRTVSEHAGAAGRKLKTAGFTNVRRLAGGMAEWTGASLPIVKGKT